MTKYPAFLPSQTILIVDDNPNNLLLLFNYLKKHDYRVLIARDGKKALNTAEKIQPDLILLDITIPTKY